MIQFCDYICGEIMFNQQLLKISIEKFCIQCGSEAKEILQNFLNLLNNYEYISVVKIEQIMSKSILKPQISSKLVNLFNNLGKSDAYTQAESIKGCKQLLLPDLDDARTEQKKYGSLYAKLGLVIGIAIAIIIY